MSQRQVERPQDKKPRPQDKKGPSLDLEIDIGETDDILKELDIIEHPERYTEEQRGCGCLRPRSFPSQTPSKGGFR